LSPTPQNRKKVKVNFVFNREEVTETFRLHLLWRYWNCHCHHPHHCRLKTVKKLEGIPRTIETVTKTDSGGRWLYHSGLCSKSLTHSHSGLCSKSHPHSHHTPLV